MSEVIFGRWAVLETLRAARRSYSICSSPKARKSAA